jgi:hypothetical protein
MARRIASIVLAASLLFTPVGWSSARAENPMGYKLLTVEQAGDLPRRNGTLGMDVALAHRITDSGMTFSLLQVKSVRSRSPAAKAGFKPGDQIIAVNGLVFPTVRSFASYVASRQPGSEAMVDYIPARATPADAQRIQVVLDGPSGPVRPDGSAQSSGGMSTTAKVAIGAGAAAILCYKLGCFSRGNRGQAPNGMAPTGR